MMIGKYNLICPNCSKEEFRAVLVQKATRFNPSKAKYICKNCNYKAATIRSASPILNLFAEPKIPKHIVRVNVLEGRVAVREEVSVAVQQHEEIVSRIRHLLRQRFYVPDIIKFVCATEKQLSIPLAKKYLLQAQKMNLAEDAEKAGVDPVVLLDERKKTSIEFWESIVRNMGFSLADRMYAQERWEELTGTKSDKLAAAMQIGQVVILMPDNGRDKGAPPSKAFGREISHEQAARVVPIPDAVEVPEQPG